MEGRFGHIEEFDLSNEEWSQYTVCMVPFCEANSIHSDRKESPLAYPIGAWRTGTITLP